MLDLDNCPALIASDFLAEQGLSVLTFSFGLTSLRFSPGLAQCLQSRWDGGLIGYNGFAWHTAYGGGGGPGGYGGESKLGGDGRYGGYSLFGDGTAGGFAGSGESGGFGEPISAAY